MNGIITEKEYLEYEQERLEEIALRLRKVLKQLPLHDIAKGTGLKWDTIHRARKAKRISFRALCRIEKYVQSRGLML